MNKLRAVLSQVGYGFYVIFHPFNGFWDLKHEKRGSVSSAGVILAMVALVFIIRNQFTGFILNYSNPKEFNVFYQITGVVMPFLLWCVANWCITTLVDGEGSFTDILITSAYALFPVVLLNIPMVIISNLITLQESAFYRILDSVSIGWFVLLLFFGIMTVHQFTVPKTLFTILVALLGMVIMIFLFLLFFTLIQDMINFGRLIYNEIVMRSIS